MNLTSLCKAYGLRPNDFFSLPSTKRTLSAVSKRLNTLPENPVPTFRGGQNWKEQGTWIHPKLAVAAGRWVSEDFEYWCDETTKSIIDGDKVPVDPASATASPRP